MSFYLAFCLDLVVHVRSTPESAVDSISHNTLGPTNMAALEHTSQNTRTHVTFTVARLLIVYNCSQSCIHCKPFKKTLEIPLWLWNNTQCVYTQTYQALCNFFVLVFLTFYTSPNLCLFLHHDFALSQDTHTFHLSTVLYYSSIFDC